MRRPLRQRRELLCSDVEKREDNDEEASNTANDLESLGTITVSFVRFRASGKYDSTVKAEGSTLKNQVLHEKNKKAGCHRVSYVHYCDDERLLTATFEASGIQFLVP